MTSCYHVRPASAGRRTSPTHRFGDASEIFLFFSDGCLVGRLFWVQAISHPVWNLRLLGYDPDRCSRHSLNMISGVWCVGLCYNSMLTVGLNIGIYLPLFSI